ncbi:uncharacterized protein LOC119791217 isoform X2 [Cyprinodon tularosa]|nr:uncharacterized protein LOC119791217 isoform X2 [Cyprinodon tularosa]
MEDHGENASIGTGQVSYAQLDLCWMSAGTVLFGLLQPYLDAGYLCCWHLKMPLRIVPAVISLLLAVVAVTGETNLTCYTSTLPEAKNIQILYDEHQSTGHFWARGGSDLAPCNLSSVFFSQHSVCINDSAGAQTVLVVFCNLTSNVKLVFEGPKGHIHFNKSECPQPPINKVSEIHKEPSHRGRICVYIVIAAFAIALGALLILKI